MELVLQWFTTEDLAEALDTYRLPITGSKAERIRRLTSLGISAAELLDGYTTEVLRDACDRAAIPFTGRKDELIAALIGCSIAQASVTVAPTILEPTRDNVVACLTAIAIPRRKTQFEDEAQALIEAELKTRFELVRGQYSVGGYLGQKIDLDIGNGKVGVELKLGSKLLGSSEAQRLIGQVTYYSKKRYGKNLVVTVTGSRDELRDSLLSELRSFIEELDIACVFLEAQ